VLQEHRPRPRSFCFASCCSIQASKVLLELLDCVVEVSQRQASPQVGRKILAGAARRKVVQPRVLKMPCVDWRRFRSRGPRGNRGRREKYSALSSKSRTDFDDVGGLLNDVCGRVIATARVRSRPVRRTRCSTGRVNRRQLESEAHPLARSRKCRPSVAAVCGHFGDAGSVCRPCSAASLTASLQAGHGLQGLRSIIVATIHAGRKFFWRAGTRAHTVRSGFFRKSHQRACPWEPGDGVVSKAGKIAGP